MPLFTFIIILLQQRVHRAFLIIEKLQISLSDGTNKIRVSNDTDSSILETRPILEIRKELSLWDEISRGRHLGGKTVVLRAGITDTEGTRYELLTHF